MAQGQASHSAQTLEEFAAWGIGNLLETIDETGFCVHSRYTSMQSSFQKQPMPACSTFIHQPQTGPTSNQVHGIWQPSC